MRDAARSVRLTEEAWRKAQSKPNPNDFPIGSAEFEKYEAEFLEAFALAGRLYAKCCRRSYYPVSIVGTQCARKVS
jgi:hypothetical protein